MWPFLGMVAAIGYTAYRKNKWNIEVYIHTCINQKYYINLIRATNQRKIGKTIVSMAL